MNMPQQQPTDDGYPAGSDIIDKEQAGNVKIDNPAIAAFESLMVLIKALQDRNDPRAQPAADALKNLLQILSRGAGGEPLPMEPPTPGNAKPNAAPGIGPGPTPPGALGAQPIGGVMPETPAEAPAASPRPRPMTNQPQQRGRPVRVLT